MKRKNIEIKARCKDFAKIREVLSALHADFRGIDEQVDTYFQSKNGFLKFREATLPFERGLISYKRAKKNGPKISNITVILPTEDVVLKEILLDNLEVIAVVKKKRELFTLDNVKFHLDTVAKLGTFIEIEAQDTDGLIDRTTLLRQCKFYMAKLEIAESDLVVDSYRDLQ